MERLGREGPTSTHWENIQQLPILASLSNMGIPQWPDVLHLQAESLCNLGQRSGLISIFKQLFKQTKFVRNTLKFFTKLVLNSLTVRNFNLDNKNTVG